MIRLIVAIDSKRGMAKNGGMPWSIPDDEQYFTDQTKTFGGNVLTGKTTFVEAYKNKPLSDRQDFILTHDTEPIEAVTLVHDLDQFLNGFSDKDLWVAGGANVFDQVMKAGKADELYITEIEGDFSCDQFFPDYSDFKLIRQSETKEQNGFKFTYKVYARTTT